MTAQERYERAFSPLPQITRSPEAAVAFNGFFRENVVLLVSRRERVAKRVQRALFNYLYEERTRLVTALDKRGVLTDLIRDAMRRFDAVSSRDDNLTKNRRRFLQDLRDDTALPLDMLAQVRHAAADVPDLYARLPELLNIAHVLYAETAGRFEQARFAKAKTYAQEFVQFADGDPDQMLLGFLEDDRLLADIVFRNEPRLLIPILARNNEIVAVQLSKQEFEELRDILKESLYERAGGALGMRDIARELRKEFVNNIPKEDLMYRTDLWARTEGCIMQNDALMELAKEGGMDGKVWQTVGDNRVRMWHVMNEADGVIPIGDTFADGSMDAGSGSVSPFQCRCAVGGAMLATKDALKQSISPRLTAEEYIAKHAALVEQQRQEIAAYKAAHPVLDVEAEFNRLSQERFFISDELRALKEHPRKYKQRIADLTAKLNDIDARALALRNTASPDISGLTRLLEQHRQQQMDLLSVAKDRQAVLDMHVYNWVPQDQRVVADNAFSELGSLMDKRVVDNTYFARRYEVRLAEEGRSYADVVARELAIAPAAPAKKVCHEFMHLVEGADPNIHTACVNFLKMRAGGEAPVSLALHTMNFSYDVSEVTYIDKWGKDWVYAGKVYTDIPATEVLSVGVERLVSNPMEFAQQDPEWFNFTLSILRGYGF